MSNSKMVLLVRTRLPQAHDLTQFSYGWAEVAKREFETSGWQVIDLAIDDAVRVNVENVLHTSESGIFLFYGHGLADQMIGQDEIALINLNNLHLLKNQKVCVVACETAKVLGREAANIARCYLGYEREIDLGFRPYDAYLEKCVNKGILAMLYISGCTIGDARQHIIDEYDYWIEYFSFGEGVSPPFSSIFASVLVYNLGALAQVFGDKAATLTN